MIEKYCAFQSLRLLSYLAAQGYKKGRSLPEFAFNADLSLMQVDDFAGNGKPQTITAHLT